MCTPVLKGLSRAFLIPSKEVIQFFLLQFFLHIYFPIVEHHKISKSRALRRPPTRLSRRAMISFLGKPIEALENVFEASESLPGRVHILIFISEDWSAFCGFKSKFNGFLRHKIAYKMNNVKENSLNPYKATNFFEEENPYEIR